MTDQLLPPPAPRQTCCPCGNHNGVPEPWPDRDWTKNPPVNYLELQHRVLPLPDQTRYGQASDDPKRPGKFLTEGIPMGV